MKERNKVQSKFATKPENERNHSGNLATNQISKQQRANDAKNGKPGFGGCFLLVRKTAERSLVHVMSVNIIVGILLPELDR